MATDFKFITLTSTCKATYYRKANFVNFQTSLVVCTLSQRLY